MKSVLTALIFGTVHAQECSIPSELPEGLNIFCGDDNECFAWCDDETKLPAGGRENFNCLEYALDSIPFPTECKSKFCAPPNVPNNVLQDCTAMRCTYECADVGVLNGPKEIFCNEPFTNGEGVWGMDPPICTSTVESCDPIQDSLLEFDCTENFAFESKCDFRCPTDYELVGNQIVECNYQNGHFEWSSDIPVCEFAGILPTETPTESSTVEIPDDVGSPDGEKAPGTGSENTEEKGECEGSIALECWSKLQMIIGIVTGGIIIIIIIAVTVACIMKKKNDRSKSNKDAFLWDNNPTIQKERDRGSSRGNQSTTDDRIVAPNNQYENEQSVPSHSFFRQPSQQRTQYMQSQRRNDLQVSSPQRNNFGPYSEVAINPRTGQDMPEEGMPFINDPSNRDNESHYPVSRGPSKNQNYDYYSPNRAQQNRNGDNLSTFFPS